MENNDRQIELKFQRFFTVNFPKVKNFAQMLLKSEADAEDVAQDVFCKLWLQPELWLDNDKELDNYIFIMTYQYKCLNLLYKQLLILILLSKILILIKF